MKRLLVIIIAVWISSLAYGQWLIDQNFDSLTGLPVGWTTHDDGDGMIWRNLNNASHAYSGTRAAFCDNYLPNQNADWLITPQLTISQGDSLHFYTRSWISTEPLKVYVSTTGTAISNFSNQIINLTAVGTTYQGVHYNLSAFAGQQIYIGFLWNCSNYGILIDDIRIGQPLIIQPVLNLPETLSFFQNETLSLDFTPYITTTDLATASLSVSGNTNINVNITGLTVNLSSPAFHGTETMVFTLHDGSSGLTASDTVEVTVNPEPAVDLTVLSISSPGVYQYLNIPFTPALSVINNGNSAFSDVLQVTCRITDNNGTQVYDQSSFQTVSLSPGQSVGLSFSQACIPATEGNYSAVFTVVNADGNPGNNSQSQSFEVVNRIVQGGPDAFGYRFIDSNAPGGPVYNWIDISASGTSSIMYGVPTFEGDDNFSEPIPLGFGFPFYGFNFSEAYVDINGEILLGTNNWYDAYPGLSWDNDGNMFNYMYPIPGYTQMPGLIAAFWDDLLAVEGTSDIYFQTLGTAPNRYTVIQWNNLKFLSGTGGIPQLKFQIILHENGEIVMQYHTVSTGQIPTAVPHAMGKSATVAIQNLSADIGLCYLREIVQNNTYIGVEPAGNLLHDGLAIRFYTGVDTQAPVITHSQPGNTFNQNPVLSSSIVDLSPLQSNVLHYNYGEGWLTAVPSGSSGNSYTYELQELPLGCTFSYYFTASDSQGNSSSLPSDAPANLFSFKILPTAGANVLLAYSGNQDYQRVELPVYEGLFNDLDLNYDVYDWEEYPSYTFPDQYQAIFVYASTGNQGAKADTLSVALMNYMDSGTVQHPRNVFMSSDGFAANTHAQPNDSLIRKLFNGYFRSNYVATGFGGGTNGLAGPDVFSYQSGTILRRVNSPIGTVNMEYDVYANSPDCIFYYSECPDTYADQVQYPEIGASAAFTFQDGPVGGNAYLLNGVAATSIELPIYRAFYFSFDFSQLSDPVQRHEWMSDLVDWFELSPVANDDQHSPLLQTGFVKVYPNPFNPETKISFSLATPGRICLGIYNLKGQKVRSLAQANYPQGTHSLIWNGLDDNGRAVSSGVYFARLTAENKSFSHKLVLIK